MPRKRRARRMRGGSLRSTLGKINNYLKRTKAISKVSGALSGVIPYADTVHKYSSMAGYGTRRRHRRHRRRY